MRQELPQQPRLGSRPPILGRGNYELRDSSFVSEAFWSELFDAGLLDAAPFESELLDSEPFDLDFSEEDEPSLESPFDPESEPLVRESVA